MYSSHPVTTGRCSKFLSSFLVSLTLSSGITLYGTVAVFCLGCCVALTLWDSEAAGTARGQRGPERARRLAELRAEHGELTLC